MRVSVLGINDGCDSLESLRDRVWVNEYVLKGQLGRGTVDNKIRGKVNRHYAYGKNLMRPFLSTLLTFFSNFNA
ncbi:unnamed protein product [Gongylonema pulchrum]|uniref:Transposase n=1 Tax=Gongylonema pulchrum TaxID=637853 RepID=A0A183EHP2_9BILA|nr:unnamed protein product [Gongylonema pulchrum]